MGMEQRVEFGPGGCPLWSDVASLLARSGFAVQIRMIDDQLAFPDETPPETWRELRVGTLGGMVTVRRDGNGVWVVTWGNADTAMRKAWNALTWAFAETAKGTVITPAGPLPAQDYLDRESLPFPASRTDPGQ